jgi:hypothetical protein
MSGIVRNDNGCYNCQTKEEFEKNIQLNILYEHQWEWYRELCMECYYKLKQQQYEEQERIRKQKLKEQERIRKQEFETNLEESEVIKKLNKRFDEIDEKLKFIQEKLENIGNFCANLVAPK